MTGYDDQGRRCFSGVPWARKGSTVWWRFSSFSRRSIQVAANYEVGHLRVVELRGSHMNILRMYASCGNTRAKLQVVRRGLSEGAKGSQGAKGFAPLGSIGLTSTIPGRPIGSTRARGVYQGP